MTFLNKKSYRSCLHFGILLTSALLLLIGCSSLPPTIAPEAPRRGIVPRSYKMKIAVFNFLDQTGSAGKLIETVPDVLSTEMFNTGRFEVKERAGLRVLDQLQQDKIEREYKDELDARLVGSITRFSVDDHLMTLDVRAFNAYNGTVMFAGHFDVHYSGVLDVKADRKDIARISEALYAAFPLLGDPNIRIASVSGETVTINLGEKDGVKTGMGALVTASGDTLKDPVTGEELADAIYVGEVYVVEVSPKSSKAVVAKTVSVKGRGRSAIKLGDAVRFK